MTTGNESEVKLLNELLDKESEEAKFDGLDDSSSVDARRGLARDWSVRELSQAYVRYRPELIRYSFHFLRDHDTAEEIVQDAFLYLLNSMPEIESESGLLKFLKWKVRNLCIDVLRSKSSNEVGLEDYDEPGTLDDGFLELERIEDAAVIRMALAKLSARHREALLASVYEEKSIEQISEQLTLSPNATRQLLFRARASFKFALFGEAQLEGKSASQLLSMAASKASREMKGNIGNLSLVVAAVLAGGLLFSQVSIVSNPTLVADSPPPVIMDFEELRVSDSVDNSTYGEIDESITSQVDESVATSPLTTIGETRSEVVDVKVEEEPLPYSSEDGDSDVPQASLEPRIDLSGQLTTKSSNAGFYVDVAPSGLLNLFSHQPIEVFAGTGVSAFVDYDPASKSVAGLLLVFSTQEGVFLAVPKVVNQPERASQPNLVEADFEGYELLDHKNNLLPGLTNSEARGFVSLSVDASGNPTAASIELQG